MNLQDHISKTCESFNKLSDEFTIKELDTDTEFQDEGDIMVMYSLERNGVDLGVINQLLDTDFNIQTMSVNPRDGMGDGTEHMFGDTYYGLECETIGAALEWLKSLHYEEYEEDGRTFAFAASA